MKHIYVVEDEKSLSKLLETYLKEAGYQVSVFDDGLVAKSNIQPSPDLWVLDIMLPGLDGYALIKEIKKQTPNIPVIFMSARSAELDRVIGLEMGSDDYLPKPFLPRELVLRVNKILNRTQGSEDVKQIKLGSGIFDLAKRQLQTDDEVYNLSTKEYDLLVYMIGHRNEALSRNTILNHVWGLDYYGSERVVDDTLRRLRKKVIDLPVEAVYGFGYMLRLL